MKETLIYGVLVTVVDAYEKLIVKEMSDVKKVDAVSKMNEIAYQLLDMDEPKFYQLGARIAMINCEVLADVAQSVYTVESE